MTVNNNKYSADYLNQINDVMKNRMDGNANGKKDGKVTIQEAQNDLHLSQLLAGLKEGSDEYNKLKALTDQIPEVLKKYAGKDGIFQAEEWADFINGKEWNAVIDQYKVSSNFAKWEMKQIDNSGIKDGKATKGEVKVGLLNNLQKTKLPAGFDKNKIGARLETLVDKYAGEDGTFTLAEYTALKNDKEYKQIINDMHLVPFGLNDNIVE